MSETDPDEDVLAVDCEVKFPEASVRVQVKCTSGLTIGGRGASWPVEDGWVQAWSVSMVPAYFVLVIVGPDLSAWLQHRNDGTHHHAAAFWRRLPPSEGETRLRIPKNQRLTADTLPLWHQDLRAAFRGGGTP